MACRKLTRVQEDAGTHVEGKATKDETQFVSLVKLAWMQPKAVRLL